MEIRAYILYVLFFVMQILTILYAKCLSDELDHLRAELFMMKMSERNNPGEAISIPGSSGRWMKYIK